MKSSLALLGASIAVAVGTAYGQIVQYNFTSSSAASLVNGNATATAFTGGSGVSGAGVSGGAFQATGFDGNADAGAANTAGDYFTFSLTANSGFKINATSISFDVNSSTSSGGGRGPDNTGIFVSLNGGAFSAVTLSPSSSVTRDATFETKTATLSASLVNSIAIRFVGFGTGNPATQAAGFMYVDNVSMAGSVTVGPVPEPEEYAAVAGVALIGFGAWRRWSARKA